MTTIRLTLLTTHHSYWCDKHAEGKDLFIWDVAHFSEETTKRDIVVNRDIPAAVNIGVLALLRAKQRFQFRKQHGTVDGFSPSLGLWTPGTCWRDATGKVVIGRLNKDKDNVIDEVKTLAQLCADAGWSQPPYRYMPGCIKYKKKKLPDVCSQVGSTSSRVAGRGARLR